MGLNFWGSEEDIWYIYSPFDDALWSDHLWLAVWFQIFIRFSQPATTSWLIGTTHRSSRCTWHYKPTVVMHRQGNILTYIRQKSQRQGYGSVVKHLLSIVEVGSVPSATNTSERLINARANIWNMWKVFMDLHNTKKVFNKKKLFFSTFIYY